MKKFVQSSAVRSRIEELRKEAAAYRRAQGESRCRPSEALWQKAIELCRRPGARISAVAEATSVSDQGLRNRLKIAPRKVRKPKALQRRSRATFMEISPQALQPAAATLIPPSVISPRLTPQALIELERRDGIKLRLAHLPSSDFSLKALLAQFLADGGGA